MSSERAEAAQLETLATMPSPARMRTVNVAAVFLLFTACASGLANDPCDAARAARLCDVIDSASQGSIAEVTVRGIYQSTPHYEALFSRDCESSVNVHAANDYVESVGLSQLHDLLRDDPHARVEVVVRGTLRVGAAQESFGPGLLSYDLAVHEYLCARRTPDGG